MTLQKFLVTTRPLLSEEKFYTKANKKILQYKFCEKQDLI